VNRKLSFSLILITILLLLILYIANTFYNNPSDNLEALLFLGNKNLAPIIYEENGIAKGVVVDITKALADKVVVKIDVKATDWEEAQKKVLSGDADALLQINSNPERELIYDFSDELLKSEFSIFIRNGNTEINSVNDLKDKNVGTEAGGYPYRLLNSYEGINIVIIPDWTSGFKMIKAGEIDAIVVDRWIGEYELAQGRVTGIQVIEQPVEISYSRIGVKKGNTELLNSINAGLKMLKEDGTMADILSNWRGKRVVYVTEEYINRTILYTLIVILIAILLLTILGIQRVKKLNIKLEQEVNKRTRELSEVNKRLLRANEKLKEFSMVDGLTNISNRRYFDRALQKSWNISMRENLPLSMIMIDIDFFKNYNDTYGHLAGDQCLIKVANLIKNTLNRPGDFVARYGGEEFVVLLYNTPEDGAVIIAEKIRSGVEDLNINNEGSLLNIVTVSLGVATIIPGQNRDPETLVEAADQAMYRAKKHGRNKVVRNSAMDKIHSS